MVGYLNLLSITSAIQIYQNIYPSTIKLSTRLACYMFNLVWAYPRKFRVVSLFLLINCVPNTDKKTMGQGARMTNTLHCLEKNCSFVSNSVRCSRVGNIPFRLVSLPFAAVTR